jgi:hypothetical protein
MSDIVERLRDHPKSDGTVTEQFREMILQRKEAAEEIERLQAALRTLLEKTDYTQDDVEAARRALEGKDKITGPQ